MPCQVFRGNRSLTVAALLRDYERIEQASAQDRTLKRGGSDCELRGAGNRALTPTARVE